MQTAEFVEFLAVSQAQAKNPLFDIIVEDKITIQSYCNALIDKILKLNQSQFPAFIDYQFNLVKNPEVWICKLEKLLANNEAFFSSKTAMSRYNKLYFLIEKKRTELQCSSVKIKVKRTPKRLINANSDDRHFSFFEVKNHIETLPNFTEKIIYLTEEVFAYKQADKFSINTTLQVYDEQCSQLIEQLQTIRKMRADFEKEQQERENSVNSSKVPQFKIKINGPINILTDVYKQMMYEVKPNGTPYIQYKIKEITKFICDNYIDEHGNELSSLTIRTYLSPTRSDKDPNNDWRIKL
jgi:hypothetical protein